MEELNLASQEAAVEVLTIQNELMKFKNYGVHFIEWLNRSKFDKNESNHKIVTQFYKDHAATFPKLSKLVRSMINLPASSAVIEREFSTIKDILTAKRNRLSDSKVLQLLKARQYESFMKVIKS